MKKSYEHYKRPVKVLYEAIKEYLEETADVRRVSLRAITEILGVSRSGFKSWLCRKPSESSKRRDSVKKEISKIHEESHGIYGAPKITEELKKKDM
ncbi:MAG: IS3 family transposase [Catenibacterium sp.]